MHLIATTTTTVFFTLLPGVLVATAEFQLVSSFPVPFLKTKLHCQSSSTFIPEATRAILSIIHCSTVKEAEEKEEQQQNKESSTTSINTTSMGFSNSNHNNTINHDYNTLGIKMTEESFEKEHTTKTNEAEPDIVGTTTTTTLEASGSNIEEINATDGNTHDVLSRPFATAHSKSPYAIGERFWETGFVQSLDIEQEYDKPLAQMTSNYQDIRVYSNKHYGKILVLDGIIQVTELDGNAYNEMMTHIPMMSHSNPKRVLVLGGGDGYVVTEVLKHSSVEHVDHVELDEGVIKFCSQHFPQWSNGWKDERVKLHIMDGSTFVSNAPSNSYDVIIQDSSDPYVRNEDGTIEELPSTVLFTDEHFSHCYRLLSEGGVFCMQAETFQLPDDFQNMHLWRKQILNAGFHSCKYGTIYVGSYPIGQIGLLLATTTTAKESESYDDKTIQQRFDEMCQDKSNEPTYYWPALQESCFILPRWVHKALYDDDNNKEATNDNGNDNDNKN